MAPTLDQLLRSYRRQLIELDRQLAQQLLTAHRAETNRLRAEVDDLMRALRSAGTITDPARWARDTRAARVLLAAADRNMAEFGAYAAQQIEARMRSLIDLAAQHDEALTYASISAPDRVTPATRNAIRSAFSAIPVEAVTNIVGALEPGSPLRELFDSFGSVASRRLGESLVSGITRGQGAEQIARTLRDSLDGDAARALTIARTETHRAYRSASLARYRANPRVYAGWRWHASLDRRTCPVCIAQHGSEHALDEEFGSHPNCRCRPVGITRTLTEITGDTSPQMLQIEQRIEAARPLVNAGEEWFADLDEATQREIVGPLKLRALQAGQIELRDVVVERVDPRWGRGHRTASLREALDNARRRGVTVAAPPTRRTPAAPTIPPREGSINVSYRSKRARARFDEGIEAIYSVHRPAIDVDFGGPGRLRTTYGRYTHQLDGRGLIQLRDLPSAPRTAVHELGHAIDYQMFGSASRAASDGSMRADNPLHEWRQAIDASTISARIRARWTGNAENRRFARYASSPRELWARSYEQWIAARTSNENMQRITRERIESMPDLYWNDEEFAAIAQAMDRLLLR